MNSFHTLAPACLTDAERCGSIQRMRDAIFMIAMIGYPRSVPTLSIRCQAVTGLRRSFEQLGLRPTHANLTGSKS